MQCFENFGGGQMPQMPLLVARLNKLLCSSQEAYSTETVINASSLITIFYHCHICRQCSFSMRRCRLSKAANLRLKIPFSRYCHSAFVYDTGSVYFTYTFMLCILFRIRPFSLFSLMVFHCSFYHLKFKQRRFSTAVGHYER